jgi:hypothetical protein
MPAKPAPTITASNTPVCARSDSSFDMLSPLFS